MQLHQFRPKLNGVTRKKMRGEPGTSLERAAIYRRKRFGQHLAYELRLGDKSFGDVQIGLSVTNAFSHQRRRMPYEINVVHEKTEMQPKNTGRLAQNRGKS